MWNMLLTNLTYLTSFLLVVIVLRISLGLSGKLDRSVLASMYLEGDGVDGSSSHMLSSDELISMLSFLLNGVFEGVVEFAESFFSLFCAV